MADLEKAFICDPDTPTKKYYVQFNPNTLEYSAGQSKDSYKGVTARDGQGSAREPQKQSSPILGPEGSMLSVKLFFHTYTSHEFFSDVRAKIYNIRAFLPPGKGNSSASSPRIQFAWGTLAFTGTLESFHVSYQMFAHDGTPVQAEVSISIRGEDLDVSADSRGTDQNKKSKKLELEEADEDPPPDGIIWLFQEDGG
ncbi:MAG: hypothetical protein K2K53_06630 [Oscillospiraceae bacterium]|nr:hypothetical protein [Oscillospiraceae bacterium]